MPDPREAVYDVLLAKKRRADEAAAAAAKLEAAGHGWAEYEEANQRANSAYNSRH